MQCHCNSRDHFRNALFSLISCFSFHALIHATCIPHQPSFPSQVPLCATPLARRTPGSTPLAPRLIPNQLSAHINRRLHPAAEIPIVGRDGNLASGPHLFPTRHRSADQQSNRMRERGMGETYRSCSLRYAANRSNRSFSSASFAARLAAACAAFFFCNFVIAACSSCARCFPAPVVGVRCVGFLCAEDEVVEILRAENRLVDDIPPFLRGVSHDGVSPLEEPAIGFLGFDQPSVGGLE